MTTRISLAVTYGFAAGLKSLARDQRTTISEVIRHAVLTHPDYIYYMANFTSTNLPDEIGDRERARTQKTPARTPDKTVDRQLAKAQLSYDSAVAFAAWKQERRERDQAFRDTHKAQQKTQRKVERK